ncbi:MAG: glycosyltransferase family 2 protein, partial [Candidatus Portnoybacteria bacterium CG_4_10_14_0_2_um_filter_44_20]
MFKPLVSIIIPNLNGEKFLEDCLESLREQTCRNFEIILIDNGSTDNSVSRAKKFFPEVKIIKNQENLGFAKANNQGFEISKGEYIATLNNDTVVDRNWLKELVAVAEKDENIGMVASKILLAKEGNKIDSVGVNIALDGMTKQRGGL